MPNDTAWVLIKGDGLAYEGKCRLLGVVFTPDANYDYADIYDGLDTTSGKRFCRLASSTRTSLVFSFVHPPEFAGGIYVDAYDAAIETTVLFEPLEL